MHIQLFRERLSEKMCTWQFRKVIWDMINTLSLSNLLLLLSFSTHRHMSMASLAILSNFFEKQWTQNHPQYLSGLSGVLFPTTFLEIAVYKPVIMRLNITHCTLWDCPYICIVIFYNVDVIRLVGRKPLWSWDKHKSWLLLSYLVLRNKILLCHWPTRKQWVLN